jgi:anti-sigma regulatory factor (Ser/Thr protein kinase)
MAAETSTAPNAATAPLSSGDQRIRFAIAGGPQAPERARAWLEHRVAWLSEDARQQLLLLSSELVNNAVRHGGAGKGELIGVAIWATRDGVGVEVSDAGPGFTPHTRQARIDEPGGWGLVLVERMAARWGVVRDRRTRVWFELAAQAG